MQKQCVKEKKQKQKTSTPHNSVVCRTTFSTNGFLYDFSCVLRGHVGMLAYSSLQCCFYSLKFVGIYLCMAL